MKYQGAIGLEIHIELNTRSKMFCASANDPLEQHPNINVCPVCLGLPGVLPTINREAIKKVIKTGLAFDCQISRELRFDRKNYFYPDLPKGYQISQHLEPLCRNGFLFIGNKKIRLREIHLEEDTGKLIHPEAANYSLVDFNRAGVPLMEIVTEPDLTSGQEARCFAQEVQLIVRYLDVSAAEMEKGQMRLEANISLSEDVELGVRVELKNINSFRALEKAIDYEIARQAAVLNSGQPVMQETRGWNEAQAKTVLQREKERAQDYRYFPEPDLPAVKIARALIEQARTSIPELPAGRRRRLVSEYGLSQAEVEFFVENKEMGEFFEKVISELEPGLARGDLAKLVKLTSNYLRSDLWRLLKESQVEGEDFLIGPENFAELMQIIFRGEISSRIAKKVLAEMFASGNDPSRIIEERGWGMISGEKELTEIVRQALAENPKAARDYRAGKEEVFEFLIGQVMAISAGKANPDSAKKILKKLL